MEIIDTHSQLKYLVFSVKIFRLTVDCEQGGVGNSLSGHVARDAAVVGGVRQLGLRHQEVARAWDDEVGVHLRVDLLAIPQPAEDSGLGLPPGRVTSQLSLLPNFDVGRVGRGLEIFAQIWNKTKFM